MPTLRCEMRRIVAGTPRLPTSRPEPASARFSTAPERRALLARSSPSRRVTSSSSRRGASTSSQADSTLDIFTTSDAPVLDALGLFRRALSLTADRTEVTEDVLSSVAGSAAWPLRSRPPAPAAQVRVIEQALEFGEIGAGLQLGPNAMRAFDRLGVYDAVARLRRLPLARCVPRRRRRFGAHRARLRGQLPEPLWLPVRRRPPSRRSRTPCSRPAGPSRASRWRTPHGGRCPGNAHEQPRSPSRTARPTAPRICWSAPTASGPGAAPLDDSEPQLQRPRRLPRCDPAMEEVPADGPGGSPRTTCCCGSAPASTSCSTRCAAARCTTRSPSTSGRPDAREAGGRRRPSSTQASPSPATQVRDSVTLLDTHAGLARIRPRPAADLEHRPRGRSSATPPTPCSSTSVRAPARRSRTRGARRGLSGASPTAPGPSSLRTGPSPERPDARPWPARGAPCGTPRTRPFSPLRNRVFRLRRPDDYADLDWLYADASNAAHRSPRPAAAAS